MITSIDGKFYIDKEGKITIDDIKKLKDGSALISIALRKNIDRNTLALMIHKSIIFISNLSISQLVDVKEVYSLAWQSGFRDGVKTLANTLENTIYDEGRIIVKVNNKNIAEINRKDDTIIYNIKRPIFDQIVLSAKCLLGKEEELEFIVKKLVDIFKIKPFRYGDSETNSRKLKSADIANTEMNFIYNELKLCQKLDTVLNLNIKWDTDKILEKE